MGRVLFRLTGRLIPRALRRQGARGNSKGERSARRGRRWYLQYSLRSLLGLTVLCAVALSLWKVYLAPYYRQKPAIAELRRMGIEYHVKPAEDPRWVGWLVGKEPFVRVVGVTDRDRTHHYSGDKLQRLLWIFDRLPFLEWLSFRGDFTDADLVHLRHMDRLRLVGLPYSRIQGHGLSHLGAATQLWDVRLYGCASFADRGLEYLKGHNALKWLDLQGTQVTDEGLRALKELPRLERLGLNNTAITDAGLAHLGSLHQLERLFLDGTQISDAGLRHLEGLRKLQLLGLSNTAITGEGFAHLRHMSPQFFSLDLAGTQITEENIREFEHLPRGTIVDVSDTQVSPDAIRQLRPDLRFKRWRWMLESGKPKPPKPKLILPDPAWPRKRDELGRLAKGGSQAPAERRRRDTFFASARASQ